MHGAQVSNEPVVKAAKENPNARFYDKTGKDVVGASSAPTASGRYACFAKCDVG